MKRSVKLAVTVGIASLSGALSSAVAPARAQPIEIEEAAFGLGTLTRADGALDADLWAGAEPQVLAQSLARLPRAFGEPAYLDAARRVLLSPAEAPDGADDALAGAKLLAAAELGFYREAGELAELAPQLSAQPALTKVAALSALLEGDVRTACQRGARLTRGQADPFFLRLRFLCYVDAGEDAAADLTLGLLRDQGLGEGADRMFTALQTSGDLGSSVSPDDAFAYAAAQMLGEEVSVQAVPELPGSVLAAVARDRDAGADLRLPALERALALGLIGTEEGQRLAGELATTPLAAEVVAAASERPGSLGSAEAMARSFGSAASYDGFKARAVLFADALAASEPVRGFAPDADVLALGALVAGEAAAAERWIEAMRAEPGADPERFAALQDLAALASGRVRVASVPLSDPLASGPEAADLVDLALRTARGGSPGGAALVALSGLGTPASDEAEPIRQAVVLAMLDQSGLADGIAVRIALDAQAAAVFAEIVGQDRSGGGAGGGPVPRIKPNGR